MSGWATVDIPLTEDPNNWDNKNGFNRTGWAGISGNKTFDTDRIKGFAFEFSGKHRIDQLLQPPFILTT